MSAATDAAVPSELPPLIPLPAKVDVLDGEPVQLDPARIEVPDDASSVRDYLASILGKRPTGGSGIALKLDPTADVGNEGYTLVCDDDGVIITAAAPAGLFYGVQTLRQLAQLDLRQAGIAITCPRVRIEDRPRFQWRGLHVDSGRHLQDVETLLKLLDEMARHKLNVFHWHLTEDQGWRIQIDAYPRLTNIGSQRAESPKKDNSGEGDGIPYGGFYTKDEIRRIVAYASEWFITVMPEIEVPGHTAAALAAYPQFGNTDIPDYDPHVYTRFAIMPYTFAPKPETLEFINAILTETLDLFPSPYIHIGGDEAPSTQWEQSSYAQQFMKENDIKDPHHIQAWFNRHLDEFLAEHGRRMIGWDEVLDTPLPQRVVVMSWRGVKGGQEAAAKGHDVVMAPNTFLYFDYVQGDRADEPVAIGGGDWQPHLPIEKVYSFNPLDGIAPENHEHILGVQGQLWTEFIWSDEKLEYMAFPRTCALAELAWTPQEKRDWTDFESRLEGHLERLRVAGINYRELDGGAAITPVE